jgi:hypothetical protein
MKESMVGGGLVWYRVCRLSFYLVSDDTSFVGVLAPLALRVLAFFLPYSPRLLSGCTHKLLVDSDSRLFGGLVVRYGFWLYESW